MLSENDFDIYAIDAPAHGFSSGSSVTPLNYAQAVDYLVTKFDINYLVGHSFGGFTAIYYDSSYTSDIEKIVTLAPTNAISDIVSGMQEMMGFSSETIDAFNQVFVKSYGNIPDYFRASKLSENINSKGLIIHDKNDRVLPHSGSLEIHQQWKDSEMLSTDKLGHRLLSGELDQKILNFLRS